MHELLLTPNIQVKGTLGIRQRLVIAWRGRYLTCTCSASWTSHTAITASCAMTPSVCQTMNGKEKNSSTRYVVFGKEATAAMTLEAVDQVTGMRPPLINGHPCCSQLAACKSQVTQQMEPRCLRVSCSGPHAEQQPNLITRLHAVISQPELQVGHCMHKVCMPDTGRDMDAIQGAVSANTPCSRFDSARRLQNMST